MCVLSRGDANHKHKQGLHWVLISRNAASYPKGWGGKEGGINVLVFTFRLYDTCTGLTVLRWLHLLCGAGA